MDRKQPRPETQVARGEASLSPNERDAEPSPMERFKSLAKQLLQVSRVQLREEEMRQKEKLTKSSDG